VVVVPDEVTVIADVAVWLPLVVVTVIVAVPAATPVTKPLLFTVATPVLLDDQVTALLVALDGETVAVSCCVDPEAIDAEVGLTVTPVTATALTVIADVAVLLPSLVVTVIVALPAATAVTRPVELTVATEVLLDDQVTAVLVALLGAMVAVSCCVAPVANVADVGLTVTPVTETGLPGLLLYQVLFSYQPFVPRFKLAVWLDPSLNIRLVEVTLVNV